MKEYVKLYMQILPKFNDLTLIQRMVNDRHFLLTHNSDKIQKDKVDFYELRWSV